MKNIYIDVREYKGWARLSWQKEENEPWFVHFPDNDNDINNEKMIIRKIIEKAVKSITCEFAVDCFVRRCKPLTPSHKSRVKGNIKVTA